MLFVTELAGTGGHRPQCNPAACNSSSNVVVDNNNDDPRRTAADAGCAGSCTTIPRARGIPGAYRRSPPPSSAAAKRRPYSIEKRVFPVRYSLSLAILSCHRGGSRGSSSQNKSNRPPSTAEEPDSTSIISHSHHDSVLDELDRLGVPTIRDVIAIEVNNDDDDDDDDNNDNIDVDDDDGDDEIEEHQQGNNNNNIPLYAQVPHATAPYHHADLITTTSICCLNKGINRVIVKWITCILGLVFVAFIASMGTIIILDVDCSDEQQQQENNVQHIQEVVSLLSSQEHLQDPNSPQRRALNWLLSENNEFYHFPAKDGWIRLGFTYQRTICNCRFIL